MSDMSDEEQSALDRGQLDELLRVIFAVSKEYLATFDPSFDPSGQEHIKVCKRAVYDAYVQRDYTVLFTALEVLLSALENIEISYLERRRRGLETHVDTYVKEALGSVQTNTTTPYMEPVDVDQGLGGSGAGSDRNVMKGSLPYDAWRKKIERIYAQHDMHKSLNGKEAFLEVVMIWSSMGVMCMYILGMIEMGPLLRYGVVGIGALGLLSMVWKLVRYA